MATRRAGRRSSNPSRKVSIRDGHLLMQQEIIDPQDGQIYDLFVEYDVLENGELASGLNYKGSAVLTGDRYTAKSDMKIGDRKYTIVRTENAGRRWLGFNDGLMDFPEARSLGKETEAYRLGYQEAQAQKMKRVGRRENPTVSARTLMLAGRLAIGG